MAKNKKIVSILCIVLVILTFWFISKSIDSKPKKEVKKQVSTKHKTKKLKEDKEEVDKTNKDYQITKKDGVYYINNLLIVNKTYALPATYQPKNPYKEITSDYLYGENYIEKHVMEAYLKMKDEAAKEGLNLKISSGYRSYKVQVDLYNNYANRDGKDAADKYSARPGHSEHQSGLAFDLNGTNEHFLDTKEGKWLNDNCYRFGFILRFPKGSEDKTGYMYEAWHFRYVGKSVAKKLYNNGDWISIEEYYGINSKYS